MNINESRMNTYCHKAMPKKQFESLLSFFHLCCGSHIKYLFSGYLHTLKSLIPAKTIEIGFQQWILVCTKNESNFDFHSKKKYQLRLLLIFQSLLLHFLDKNPRV